MAKKNIFLFTLFVKVISLTACQIKDRTDPCMRFNTREVPFLDSRHPNEQYRAKFQDVNKFCDLYALNDGIWYISDYNITQACVEQESCGSRLPIWLNGTVPSHADGAVNRSACVRTYHSCCEKSYTLMIKNCFYHYVYCFWELPDSCPQRFCFDIDLSRVTTTTTTTTTSTTAVPKASPNATNQVDKSNTEKQNDGQSHVIAALASVTVVAVLAVVILSGLIVVLKKKLASVLPNTEKGGQFVVY